MMLSHEEAVGVFMLNIFLVSTRKIGEGDNEMKLEVLTMSSCFNFPYLIGFMR